MVFWFFGFLVFFSWEAKKEMGGRFLKLCFWKAIRLAFFFATALSLSLFFPAMAASLLLLQLPRRLGRAAIAAPRLLASPQLLVLQQARRDFRATSVAARSTLSSSTAAEEEPRPPRPPPPSPTDPLRVAVVGSGTAGCYAASELFKRLGESMRVDILVRSKREGKRGEGETL